MCPKCSNWSKLHELKSDDRREVNQTESTHRFNLKFRKTVHLSFLGQYFNILWFSIRNSENVLILIFSHFASSSFGLEIDRNPKFGIRPTPNLWDLLNRLITSDLIPPYQFFLSANVKRARQSNYVASALWGSSFSLVQPSAGKKIQKMNDVKDIEHLFCL